MTKEKALKALMEVDLDKVSLNFVHIANIAEWAINMAKPALEKYMSNNFDGDIAQVALEAFPKDEK